MDAFWRNTYATPAGQNPQVTLDLDCATTPSGSPVTYLNGFAAFGNHVRTCHVPSGQVVLFGVGGGASATLAAPSTRQPLDLDCQTKSDPRCRLQV